MGDGYEHAEVGLTWVVRLVIDIGLAPVVSIVLGGLAVGAVWGIGLLVGALGRIAIVYGGASVSSTPRTCCR